MGTHDSRCVIVTGAAGGIGGALVRRLLEAGACLLAADRDVVHIERFERLEPCSVDLTDGAQVEAMVDACVVRFGRLDRAFNGAGIKLILQARIRLQPSGSAA
jgi:NAD(P)-dependent dehydrogenase (short-subunit alcohol dehydrogenase family)